MGPVRLLPDTVKAFAALAEPTVVTRTRDAGLTERVGVTAGLTAAVNDTSCSVAPVLVLLIVPANAPAGAFALMRTFMVVGSTVPLVGVSVKLD